MKKMKIWIAGLLLVVLSVGMPVSAQSGGTTELVSVSSSGTQGYGSSEESSISADGRFVAFSSEASNLVSGDTNGVEDIFVHDRKTGITERVSIASDGAQGNDISMSPSISGDGRLVAFASRASNLVPFDDNEDEDFYCDGWDVFVRDRQNGTTEVISSPINDDEEDVSVVGNCDSRQPSISADGRYVAFMSDSYNLILHDYNDKWSDDGERVGGDDVFIRDRQLGITELISLATDGTQGNDNSSSPFISTNGRFVAFISDASNLVPDDTNEVSDIFVRDRQDGTTERVSISSSGKEGNNYSYQPSISTDGRYVAFESYASDLVSGDTNGSDEDGQDVFVRDRQNGTTERVSVDSDDMQGNGDSGYPVISADGKSVFYESYASNLVSNDTNGYSDIFKRDLQSGMTERISVASDGTQGNRDSHKPSVSANGRFISFASRTTNLVPGGANGFMHIFVHYESDASYIYSISGKVTDSSGNPVSGVTISEALGHQAVTDSDGNYTLSEMAPGTYTLTPFAEGYTFASEPIEAVIESTNITDINFTGTFIGYSISGKIVDSFDRPTVGVTVSDGAGHEATTGSDGSYTFNGLDAGTYTLTPSKAYYTFTPASTGVVIIRNHKTGIDFTGSTSRYSISGKVTDSAGSPMAEVTISDGWGFETTTDADGNYIFTGLASKTYILTPSMVGYSFTPASTSVIYENTDITGVNFSGSFTGYSIFGKTTYYDSNDAIAGVTISDGLGHEVTSDLEGNYEFSYMMPGTYTLTASKAAYRFDPIEVNVSNGNNYVNYIDGFFIGYSISGKITDSAGSPISGVTISDGEEDTTTRSDGSYIFYNHMISDTYTLTVSKDGYSFTPSSISVDVEEEDVTGINFTGSFDGYLSGKVTDSAGSPILGVTISDGAGHQVVTKSDGNYLLTGLTDGTYTIIASRDGYSFTPSAKQIVFKKGDTTVINFTGSFTGFTISGKVLDSAGNPISAVTISGGTGHQAVTSSDGSYTIGGLESGYYGLTVRPSRTGYSFTPSSTYVSISDRSAKAINFTGSFTGYFISGKVTNSAGGSISGVTISDGVGHQATSASDGSYTFSGLATGTYTLTPSKVGYSFTPTSTQVVITNANKTAINFTGSTGGYSISGKVTDSASNPISGVIISDGAGHQATTASDGSYTFSGLAAGTYTLTPSKVGYSFTPTSTQVVITNANKTAINFTASLITYSISGKVTNSTGGSIPGVTISDGAGHQATSASDGSYTISGLAAGTYTLSPSKTGYNFTPVSAKITVMNADLTGVDFTARVNSSPSDLYNLYIPVLQQ